MSTGDLTDEQIAGHTREWISRVVIGCNFCPFAAKAVLRKSIRYVTHRETTVKNTLELFLQELEYLESNEGTETTLIILPFDFTDFADYLDLVEEAEELLYQEGYEGIYQVASFHPAYCFAGESPDDASNYTNRSVYPMLHILREDSITEALEHFKDPEKIPERNISFARSKGVAYLESLRAACI